MAQIVGRSDFASQFQLLTGNSPLSWQDRLFRDYFALGIIPPLIDLPTGLGKTMVMAIWLIARASKHDVPTRLIYVVDRRTVVDQATDLAETLVQNWNERTVFAGDPPAISTLRGQLADNREWSRDLSRPAIVIGTVDLIGSALLFSGYRSSYKRRPLEAGLLGQDSLLVLDEAHLSRPFEKLLGSIVTFQASRGAGLSPVKPMRVSRMSATSGDATEADSFRLDTDPNSKAFDLWSNRDKGGEEQNPIKTRYDAKKRLTIATIGEKDDLNKKIANAAIELANNTDLVGKRIVVFIRKPDDAKAIAKTIREHVVEAVDKSGTKPKKIKDMPFAESVKVLTGTMRGLERDELVEKCVFKERWLNGDLQPDDPANQSPVFLVSTSAGEVGFDLNADHLIGDEAPLDSWIQRLGRVNRRGKGTAIIQVIVKPPAAKKTEGDTGEHTIESASANAINALRQLPKAKPLAVDKREGPIFDASPRALRNLDTPNDAFTPLPITVDLTDILLDAWSMTSITERMPGRPEVGPWLRGIEDEQAQTTVAWRAELELFRGDPAPERALQAIFSKHSIRPHELLTINTGQLLELFKRIPKLKDRPADLMSTRVAVRMPRGKVVCRTLKQLASEPGILFTESTLILPAGFDGLDSSGMIDAEAILKRRSDNDHDPPSLDVADRAGYEQREDALPRLRLCIRRTDDGKWNPVSLFGGVTISERLQLECDYTTSVAIFDQLRKNDLRIRLVQPIEFDEEGVAMRSLVMLSPVSNKSIREDQLLDEHVGAVAIHARRIADALGLSKNDPVRVALSFAAHWHDEGKKADIWQQFVYGPDARGYKGKSSRTRGPKSLCGYRHELGSLMRTHHPDRCGTTRCDISADRDVRDIALHLIATHHGAGRPHFGPGQYHPFGTTEVDVVHTDAIRRFARLQRKYGWWYLAWLENLLRCADSLGSADQDAEDDPIDSEEGEQ